MSNQFCPWCELDFDTTPSASGIGKSKVVSAVVCPKCKRSVKQ